VIEPDDPDEEQRYWIETRADYQAARDRADDAKQDITELDELNAELGRGDHPVGMRGKVLPARTARRHRSTRRRQDTPGLPRRKVDRRTIGKTYTAPDGKTFRPSLLVTLTRPSYGRVNSDGTPADPDSYDYTRAARDALHFAALFDAIQLALADVMQERLPAAPPARPPRSQQVADPGTGLGICRITAVMAADSGDPVVRQ
jgi:Replication initiator protein, pSAM2